jgi:glycosyltransferase involved in cell wall biosynthesis
MKICLLCNEYPPAPHGGIGPVTQQLAEGLAAAGHQVSVVGLYEASEHRDEVINSVRVIRLKRSPRTRFAAIPDRARIGRAVRALEREHGLDIVEAPEWAGESALLFTKAPVILRLHGSHRVGRAALGLDESRSTSFFEAIALRRADRICSVSQAIVEQTANVFPAFQRRITSEPCLVLPNAIDTRVFRPLADVKRAGDEIVFIGSIKPLKGIRSLLQAFELIRAEVPCKLSIYGSDSRTAAGSSYLESELAGISEAVRRDVHYKGRVARAALPRVYSSATMAIFPSLAEAFPMVCLEAMASGVPVIFSSCGPHTEIIDDGINGLICDARDPRDIAKKALVLFRDAALRDSISRAAREKVCRQFDWTDLLAQNVRFYRAVAAGTSK